MTAALLVATSVAAFLSASQAPAQGALDVADVGRSDSGRVSAPKAPRPAAVAAVRVSAPPATVTPAIPATSAVPLPDPPLWSLPTPTVPIPVAASWPTDLPGDFRADSIVVEKGERRLTLFYRGFPVRKYRIALGRNPVGDKVSIGDFKTPEGVFYIIGRNPLSKFYKSLEISYPDSAHEERAERLGVSPGGNIMIHGLPAHQAQLGSAHALTDWTEGCIAVTNGEIDEMWRAVEMGAVIHIRP